MTYLCHCGNSLFIPWDGQCRCANCGAIYQRDPQTGGVAWMNVRIVTTNSTMPASQENGLADKR